MKHIFKIAVMSLIFFGVSCGTTSYITSSWKAPDLQPRVYGKIVVLGLVSDPDRTVREKLENHIVGDLTELGYTAVCSCDEFNPKAFENMSEDQALAKLKSAGVDAVLTVVLLDKSKESHYVPGEISYTPYAVYHNRFYGYYRTVYQRIYTPGYYVVENKYFWESNFYDLGTTKLLYSAQSRSFDPENAESMGHSYGKMIVKDMVEKAVIRDQKALKPM